MRINQFQSRRGECDCVPLRCPFGVKQLADYSQQTLVSVNVSKSAIGCAGFAGTRMPDATVETQNRVLRASRDCGEQLDLAVGNYIFGM
jgi:hypothetical protein